MNESNIALGQFTFKSYPQWDVSLPPIPPRSRLYQLPPIGIGTVKVESLTSYITRLAIEHCISPRTLLSREALSISQSDAHYLDTSLSFANTINGIGKFAEITMKGFEQLTLRHDLRYTTLLPWRKVFSNQYLLRKTRAWCDSCYEEQLAENGYTYDPLIWSIEAAPICHRHHKQLCQICPHCGKQLSFLARNYRPGHCSACMRWLGITCKSKFKQCNLKPLTSNELTKQIGFLDIIGEILSHAPNITSEPTRHTFLYNLARIIEKDAGRSINLFSDLVGVWSGKVRRWLRGWNTISIEALCQICTELKVSPIDILCETEESNFLQDIRREPLQKNPTGKSITPWSEVEYQLQDALLAVPPPALEAVAQRLGYYPAKLKSHFPLLCKQICSRYSTYKESLHPSPLVIQTTLRTALREKPPPSLQSVFRRLGCRDTGYYYYSNYPDLCTAIARRYKKYRNKAFDKKVVQEQLKVVLKEEPAPSFSSVAKRFRHTREFLRKKYPEMARAIVARYMRHLRRHRKEHAKKLRQMIRRAIKEITASGMYASEARVRNILREQRFTVGRDNRFGPALREVKAEMGI